VGDRRAREIARDVLQAFAIVGGDADVGAANGKASDELLLDFIPERQWASKDQGKAKRDALLRRVRGPCQAAAVKRVVSHASRAERDAPTYWRRHRRSHHTGARPRRYRHHPARLLRAWHRSAGRRKAPPRALDAIKSGVTGTCQIPRKFPHACVG